MSYIDDAFDRFSAAADKGRAAPRPLRKKEKPARDLSVVPRPDVVVGSGLIDLRGAPSSMEEKAKRWNAR